MKIFEVESRQPVNIEKLAAISKFFTNRSEDVNAPKAISAATFLQVAQSQGIALTMDQLKDLSQQEPLNKIIADVQGDNQTGKVVFKGSDSTTGSDQIEPDTMSVDQARATVQKMAKRASKI